MRKELVDLLNILRERNGTIAERERMWKLCILLARELGSEIEEPTKLHPPSKAVDDAPAAANF